MRTTILATLGSALILIPAANAGLIGDVMTANATINGNPVISVTETVLDGPEATGNWGGLLSYNVQADTITITSLQNSPTLFWNDGLGFEFLDLNSTTGTIVGATIIAASGAGMSDLDNSDLSWTDDSLTLNPDDLWGVAASFDQSVTILLQFSDVPAPGAFALLGLAGLSQTRRRRA